MMKRKTITATAIALMAGGLWWQFKGSPAGSANPEPASPTTTATTQTDPTKTTEVEDYFDQEDPTNPTVDEAETGQRNLATDEDLNRCVPSEGFGIVMKDWGKIRLPYSDTWPKNEPGTPVDCAPETDFGAAVVAVHALYLEGHNPQYIPDIAVDNPARQRRIDAHSGTSNPADLEMDCQPVGWDRPTPGLFAWLIYHQCGDGPLFVTTVRMQHDTGKWLIYYPSTGQFNVDEADAGIPYYPFESGD